MFPQHIISQFIPAVSAVGFKVLTIDNNKEAGGSRFVVDSSFFGLVFGYVV